MVTSQRRWQLVPWFDPICKTWDDETIVFNRFSAETHLFDNLSLEIVDSLSKASLPEVDLLEMLAQSCGVDCDDEFAMAIQTRLDVLVKLDVIRVCVN